MAVYYFSQRLRNMNQQTFDNQTPINEIFDILFENVAKEIYNLQTNLQIHIWCKL